MNKKKNLAALSIGAVSLLNSITFGGSEIAAKAKAAQRDIIMTGIEIVRVMAGIGFFLGLAIYFLSKSPNTKKSGEVLMIGTVVLFILLNIFWLILRFVQGLGA